MESNFDLSVAYVLNDEGGYAERSNEPGGACNKGISFSLLEEVWAKDTHNFVQTYFPGVTKPTFKELKELSDDAAKHIYKYYVFSRVKFDELPNGLDYVMVNTATMQGPTGATKLLQKALGLTETGKLDQETIDKASINPLESVAGLLLYQCQSKMYDPRCGPWMDHGRPKEGFGKGWSNRIIRVWNRARDMLEGGSNGR